jgi:hypothetical protein
MAECVTAAICDLRLIVDSVDEDDAACLAFTCSAFREVVCQRNSRAARWPHGVRTGPRSATASIARLLWARAQLFPIRESLRVCSVAAERGQLGVLKELRRDGSPWSTGPQGVCAQAAVNGHLEVLQWARAMGCPWDEWTGYAAAEASSQRFEILEWAVENGAPLVQNTFSPAVREGRLDVIEWLVDHGAPWEGNSCTPLSQEAAHHGHVHVLMWALSRGLSVEDSIMWDAANGGHLGVMKWALKHGFPWATPPLIERAEDTFAQVALSCNVEALQWAHDHGCPFDAKSYSSAACRASAEGIPVMEWLKEHGCPCPSVYACRAAAANGQLGALKWLRSNGCPWDAGTCRAARRAAAEEHLREEAEALLLWAQAHGCPDDALLGEMYSEYESDDADGEHV